MSESREMCAGGLVVNLCLFDNVFISVCAYKLRKIENAVTAMLQRRNSFLSPIWFALNFRGSVTLDILLVPRPRSILSVESQ